MIVPFEHTIVPFEHTIVPLEHTVVPLEHTIYIHIPTHTQTDINKQTWILNIQLSL